MRSHRWANTLQLRALETLHARIDSRRCADIVCLGHFRRDAGPGLARRSAELIRIRTRAEWHGGCHRGRG